MVHNSARFFREVGSRRPRVTLKRLQRLRDVERRVVEGAWVVNDITDIRCRRGKVLLRLSVKSDMKTAPRRTAL